MNTTRILLIWWLGLSTTQTFGQGMIRFYNDGLIDHVAGVGDLRYRAGVYRENGSGAGPEFTAGLFLLNSTTPLATATFGVGPDADKFAESSVVVIPGVRPGWPATLQIKVWPTFEGSYEMALKDTAEHGVITFQTQPLGGEPDSTFPVPPGTGGLPPGAIYETPDLAPFRGLVLSVPEPSIMSLAAIAALIIRVRSRGLDSTRVKSGKSEP